MGVLITGTTTEVNAGATRSVQKASRYSRTKGDAANAERSPSMTRANDLEALKCAEELALERVLFLGGVLEGTAADPLPSAVAAARVAVEARVRAEFAPVLDAIKRADRMAMTSKGTMAKVIPGPTWATVMRIVRELDTGKETD